MAKYHQIYSQVYDAIVSGKYAVGQRIPTEAELSVACGASRPTVARALRDLEKRGYLIRRRALGSFVTSWREARTNLFALLLPHPGEGIFAPMCDEIVRQSEAREHGVLLAGSLTAQRGTVLPRAEEFCQQVIGRKVAGVFFGPLDLIPQDALLNAQIAERIDRAGIPIILLDRDVYDYPKRSKFDLVGVDNRSGGTVLTQHLLQLGCRRIHFLTHPFPISTVSARIAGYRDAMRERGIEPRDTWIHRWDPEDSVFVRELMRNKDVEAFVCVNDLTANAFMHNLAVLGVRVPDDVRIVGFDDTAVTRRMPIGLTTLHQPAKDIGTVAVQMMMERLADRHLSARHTMLSCELIIRESCGATMKPALASA